MACEACNTIPPVTVENYAPKGSWITLAGLKTYATGPEDAKHALIAIYDIFGNAPQTIQGADLLSKALNALVIVPDFLNGRYAQAEWYAGKGDEKEKAEFMAYAFDFKNWTGVTEEVVKAGKSKWVGVMNWGAYGLCWGGKVVALASAAGTPFTASGQVHPGRLATEDAKAITIPHIVLASKGEDAVIVKEYADVLVGEGKPNVVETYPTMPHGWLGARAALGEAEGLKEYERGYNQLASFFSKYL
ncbi:hypothetical protein G7Y89_g6606 [Cudoniella acicularis]|uniref:Dienelactone hydrolase domain-containing protein n=1 Tax=Cudoniella acicularis TaxID=354080 RepID=A0A8H4RMF3_9HELO|nr:hypothetical protein G7Y89_g6606 [Cudoniella acicularis]